MLTEDALIGAAPLRSDYLNCLLTDIGLWQHAEGCIPHQRHGYSIDDEARGLIAGLGYWQAGVEPDFYGRLAQTCFRFVSKAAISAGDARGRFHNFCDTRGRWLDSVGSDDSFGRTVWGLGVAHAADAPFAPRAAAARLLDQSLPAIDTLNPWYLRAHAFTLLGLAAARVDDGRMARMADVLADAYTRHTDPTWHWFEEGMTYCNARLPQALFVASRLLPGGARYAGIAAASLDFLLEKTRNAQGSYSPVGNDRLTTRGWFLRSDAAPAVFDQQPVDAGALVECCVAAWQATREPRFRQAAEDAYGWYFGRNVHSLSVYDPQTGGVSDSVTRSGLSRNHGAESVLSVHLARLALDTLA